MKVVTKNKMENIGFDEEYIPLINQDEDYDDYRTPEESRIDAQTSFAEPAATEATSTLRLRQKLKRDKSVSLYRYLGVTGNLDLADLDQFNIKKNTKTGNIELLFLDGNNEWQSLSNQRTGEFLAKRH